MKKIKNDFRTGYIDLLINLLNGSFTLFILAGLLISATPKANEGIVKNAEMVITINWNKDINCDVDLWVRDGQKNLVSYSEREVGVMNLERDDKGARDDTFTYPDGTKLENPSNQEFVTIRGIIPGDYIANVHLFSCENPAKPGTTLAAGDPFEIDVEATVIKLNPFYKEVIKKTVKFSKTWEDKPILRFTLDPKGNITRQDENYIKIRTNGNGEPGYIGGTGSIPTFPGPGGQ
jgi:hypothetical protein